MKASKFFTSYNEAQAFYNAQEGDSSIGSSKKLGGWVVQYEEAETQHQVVKVRTGVFKVTNSAWMIFNADAGMSGRGANQYGIKNTETGERKIVGSLQKAKKLALAKASQK